MKLLNSFFNWLGEVLVILGLAALLIGTAWLAGRLLVKAWGF